MATQPTMIQCKWMKSKHNREKKSFIFDRGNFKLDWDNFKLDWGNFKLDRDDFELYRYNSILDRGNYSLDRGNLKIDIKSHVGKQPRFKWLPRFIYKPNTMKQLISFLPYNLRTKIIKVGYNTVLKDKSPDSISSDLSQNLYNRYKDEILELETLIERDLSGWKA